MADALSQVLEAVRRAGDAARPFFTADEVAGWLGVTARAVRDMMDRGELPWAMLGRRRVVVREMFVRQLAEQAAQNAPRDRFR